MLLRLLYDDQLAQASYLVGCQSTGEALVIDPNRDVKKYIALAGREGLRISAVTETHIHADYLSGARELAHRTGAKLYLSDEGTDDWKYEFGEAAGAELIRDGDRFWVGNISLDVLHTPGHTPEHLSFIMSDNRAADRPMGIFTGDFVFVGDVGRPDLLETAAGMAGTMAAGARQLFQSLQRFKELPDYLQFWPCHGAGSPCGKALGAVPQSTVGYEKFFNWALNVEDESEFVATVLEGQPEPPTYFKEMKRLNRVGPPLLEDAPRPERLAVEQIDAALEQGTTVIDLRPADAFAAGHIPGTINIPYSRAYLTWAGWLVSHDRPFALIVDESNVSQTVADFQLIGLDDVAGYWTPDSIKGWRQAQPGRELQAYGCAEIDEVDAALQDGSATVIDVRGAADYAEGHLPGAVHVTMGHIPSRISEISAGKPLIVHCQSGARSAIAAGLLQSLGRPDVRNFQGSYDAWVKAGKPVEAGAASRESVTAD
ncbi:MBL fold metallo-hydrolase [soil metagenome]